MRHTEHTKSKLTPGVSTMPEYDWMEQALEQLGASSPSDGSAPVGEQLDEIRQMLQQLLDRPDDVVID